MELRHALRQVLQKEGVWGEVDLEVVLQTEAQREAEGEEGGFLLLEEGVLFGERSRNQAVFWSEVGRR